MRLHRDMLQFVTYTQPQLTITEYPSADLNIRPVISSDLLGTAVLCYMSKSRETTGKLRIVRLPTSTWTKLLDGLPSSQILS
jgi:hypothetical protein